MEKQLSIKRMTAEGCVGMIRSSFCSKKKDVHWTAVGYKRQMNRLAGQLSRRMCWGTKNALHSDGQLTLKKKDAK